MAHSSHRLLTPAECRASDPDGHHHNYGTCNICDGGLAFCIDCKGGESELDGPCPKMFDFLLEALIEIRDLKPRPFEGFPSDWREQIANCAECHSYKGHPIQAGICDKHRQPLWARQAHDKSEVAALGSRAYFIARAAIAKATGEAK